MPGFNLQLTFCAVDPRSVAGHFPHISLQYHAVSNPCPNNNKKKFQITSLLQHSAQFQWISWNRKKNPFKDIGGRN